MILSRRIVDHFTVIAGFVVLLAVWEAAIVFLRPAPVVLPSPWHTFQALVSMAHSNEVWADIGISLFRVAAGFAIAAVMGVPVGMALTRSMFFRDAVAPTLEGLRFVIPFAWIPIASLWFGLHESGKLFITWYAAFFVIAFQTEAGFRQVDERLVKAAKTLGAGSGELLRKVYLPAAAPMIVTGLRLGLSFAWISILAAELVNAKAGIGYFTMNAADFFRSDQAFAAMGVIGVIGFLMDRAFRLLERRMFAWHRSTDAIQ
ncbi:MAG: ABC transporter permease [Myxococcales bacterium]|jgi:ABC-type nitrate/sulfonate/bicarbonate transport system permease component